MNLNSICEQVIALVKKTGQFILGHSENFDLSKVEYKGVNNLVSFVDKQAEILLVEGLSKILPHAGFITEEGTSVIETKELNWVIDPLDGTTNFLHGLPIYSISIGLIQEQEPILGVVLDLGRNDCYYATKESKAFKNGKTIQISSALKMEDGLLATGFPYMDFDQMQEYLEILKAFMKKTHGLRRLGGAAIDLTYVAHGRFEGYFEYNLNPWDVAGGAMIVKQAGGIVTDFEGGNDYIFGKSIVAAVPKVHEQMLEVIKKYWKK
ncbi:MAG TPA: inositol monophosphatase family protein [Cytophagales bacterium]|nr:inositol monophosphatase family protein [Cytophagales bacterium]